MRLSHSKESGGDGRRGSEARRQRGLIVQENKGMCLNVDCLSTEQQQSFLSALLPSPLSGELHHPASRHARPGACIFMPSHVTPFSPWHFWLELAAKHVRTSHRTEPLSYPLTHKNIPGGARTPSRLSRDATSLCIVLNVQVGWWS